MGAKVSASQNALLTLKLWQNKHHTEEMDYAAASKWAVANDLYPKPPITREERLEEEMRRAVKRATHTDPQGRTNIKTYWSVPLFDAEGNKSYKQVDGRQATPEDAVAALDDEFAGIRNDVRSHDNQRASYSDNNLFGATLERYDYNFNNVVENAGVEYDDSYNEDDFNEDK
jgi:hypothetical protein